MKLLVQKGSYIDVPDHFLIAFWGSTDCAITHGIMSICVDNYQGTFHYMKDRLKPKNTFPIKPGKKKWVGKAIPYKHPKTGRKIVGLFDRTYFLDKEPEEKNVIRCLKNLKKIMIKGKIKAVSMHPNFTGLSTLELLVHDVFENTKFGVLIRYE